MKINSYYIFFVLIFIFNIVAAQKITLTQRQQCDLEMILNGGFAPLTGFLSEQDYDNVVSQMRLADGSLWPMPITLDVSAEKAQQISIGDAIKLCTSEGVPVAQLQVTDLWKPDKLHEAEQVFGTQSIAHPAVNYLLKKAGDYYVGGKVEALDLPGYYALHYDFNELRKTPAELKHYFKEQGIERVVAFQTRNPMHRAHQELTVRASQEHDAHLLIHPVVGMTKPGDIDYVTRVQCYKKLINHYPKGYATLCLLPLAMRMAGPREALWHAIIRKNYGATHFIVGRDHAGLGKDENGHPFYGLYDAQNLVQQYADEIGITVVPFKEVAYVADQDKYLPANEIPKGSQVLRISGTQFRAMLRNGLPIPEWFSYPEIVKELRKTYPPKSKQGFTVFLTGLSGSGKSTIANILAIKLRELQDRRVTILDGDIIRTHLSKELGFSQKDRSTNVRRIGFVASEITKHRGAAICAPIAPYEDDRLFNRELIGQYGGYIEVYISTPLEVCEQRDAKGLYALAREGKITNFTGIDDPYEEPTKATLTVDTSQLSIEEACQVIIDYLEREHYI